MPLVDVRKKETLNRLEKELRNSPFLRLEGEVRSATKNEVVLRCQGCNQRERKALSKRLKMSHTSDLELQASLLHSSSPMTEAERNRTLQFYSDELLDFSSGESIICARITCYCRHHKESEGFYLRFFLIDEWTGEIVENYDRN